MYWDQSDDTRTDTHAHSTHSSLAGALYPDRHGHLLPVARCLLVRPAHLLAVGGHLGGRLGGREAYRYSWNRSVICEVRLVESYLELPWLELVLELIAWQWELLGVRAELLGLGGRGQWMVRGGGEVKDRGTSPALHLPGSSGTCWSRIMFSCACWAWAAWAIAIVKLLKP